jgi:hypothetical protein
MNDPCVFAVGVKLFVWKVKENKGCESPPLSNVL